MGVLLKDLIGHKVSEAKFYAQSLINLRVASTGDQRVKAVVAARVLMTHADDAGWSVVWPAIQQDAEFGREVALAVAYMSDERRGASIGQRLNEEQLADLYIWLARQFPYAEDPRRGSGLVGARESAAGWRDGIIHHLKMRGTPKACDAIRRIIGELPELTWLKRTLLEAEDMARRFTWTPIRPADIHKIASDPEARLIQSGDQLLEVIIESLKRLESRLHGETPAV